MSTSVVVHGSQPRVAKYLDPKTPNCVSSNRRMTRRTSLVCRSTVEAGIYDQDDINYNVRG